MDRAEELEQTARLHFIPRGERVSHLTPEQVEELKRAFGRDLTVSAERPLKKRR